MGARRIPKGYRSLNILPMILASLLVVFVGIALIASAFTENSDLPPSLDSSISSTSSLCLAPLSLSGLVDVVTGALARQGVT